MSRLNISLIALNFAVGIVNLGMLIVYHNPINALAMALSFGITLWLWLLETQ